MAALGFHGLVDLAPEDQLLLVVIQAVVTGRAGYQGEVHAQIGLGYVELENVELLAAPGKGGQPEQGLGQRAVGCRVMLTGHVAADQRKLAWLGDDVELEFLDGLAEHCTGFQQGNFGDRLGNRVRAGGYFRYAGNGGLLRLDLDHRGGLVDRRGDEGVEHAEHGEQPGDGDDQRLVVVGRAHDAGQVDAIVRIVFQ